MNTSSSESRRTNFITAIIDRDLETDKWDGRVATRFPPEPNGYLHIGHAKSICLNFGLAADYQGTCNLRFDDTNPTKEEQEYVESIQDDIKWLGFEWGGDALFASDYFETMFEYAVHLIKAGKAYVCSLSKEEIREYRGTLTEPGRESPYRTRSVEENLDLFARMRAGEFANGEHVLRAKIDMTSPNMLMRDPLLYRIVHAHHHRTGDTWCIYPMYDYAHCLEDSFEHITHSICTLEFENNRELYDWVLDNTPAPCHPQQIEFARLSLDYTIMSKRNLLQLVQDGHVGGWDDPRMPTIAGLRRRGVTPEAIRAFANLIGVAKTNSVVDIEKLEYCIRDDLNKEAPRVMCVLRPLKVVITNYPEDGEVDELEASYYPHDVPKEGSRMVPFGREIYIEREDFEENPPEGYYRLAPGREVRLRYAYFIKCLDVIKDASGEVLELHCSYDPETRGGSSAKRKVKGTLHWVSAAHSRHAEVRLYDRLFSVPQPGRDPERTFLDELNPESLVTLTGCRVEPTVQGDPAGTHYQFERQGYFISDVQDSSADHLVFNRIVTLRDTWAKAVVATGESAEAPEAVTVTAKAAARRPTKRSAAYERDKSRANDPELAAKLRRFSDELGVPEDDARLLTGDLALAEFFEEAVAAHDNARTVAKWVVNEVLRELKERSIGDLPFDGKALGELVALVDAGTINGTTGKAVFGEMMRTGDRPATLVQAQGLAQVDSRAELQRVVEAVIAADPGTFARFADGDARLQGVFIGQVMRATGGKADAALVREILAARAKR